MLIVIRTRTYLFGEADASSLDEIGTSRSVTPCAWGIYSGPAHMLTTA
jgi:hypothetical protein